MKRFTEAYQKARTILRTQKYREPDWQKFLSTKSGVKGLMGATGPEVRHADAPDKVRRKIHDESNHWLISWLIGGKPGDVIYQAAEGTPKRGRTERAAALKFVRHFYRAQKRGAQDVWIYSPPGSYKGWVFDELKGSASDVRRKLDKDDELFSKTDMKNMCAALGLALKISERTKNLLSKKDEKTKKLVKRWFLDEDCGETEMKDALKKLGDGFVKIAASCNSNKLVFTDYPDWRHRRNDYMGGAIPGGEGGGFPVIYIEGAFTKKAENSAMLWTCARTIIHEFSHHDIRTEDHRYRHSTPGLRPSKSGFPFAKAITNADSWACFAIDLAGYLSASDRKRFLD